MRTADGVIFDWHIEVYELQPDGRYHLLTQKVSLRSFPLADIRAALSATFSRVEMISDGPPAGQDHSAGQDHEDRIWFACSKPS